MFFVFFLYFLSKKVIAVERNLLFPKVCLNLNVETETSLPNTAEGCNRQIRPMSFELHRSSSIWLACSSTSTEPHITHSYRAKDCSPKSPGERSSLAATASKSVGQAVASVSVTSMLSLLSKKKLKKYAYFCIRARTRVSQKKNVTLLIANWTLILERNFLCFCRVNA